jgi:hypothetical protein
MKVRNGFVSNSSSSSFLVGIPTDCVTLNDFLEHGILKYGWDGKNFSELSLDDPVEDCDIYSDEMKTNRDCISKLWEDVLLLNDKAKLEDWIDNVCEGYAPETTFFSHEYQFIDTLCMPHNISNTYAELYGREKADKIAKRLEKIGDEWNAIVGEALVREMFIAHDDNVYEISYSDNNDQALMEHGSFWRYIRHIKISHH